MNINNFTLVFSICFCSCFNDHNTSLTTINGKVVSIIDGDTYDLLLESKQTIRVRMEGIDAPEKGMPYSKVSKDFLGDLCFGKQVRFTKSKEDSSGRAIGFSYLDDGRELSHEMVKAGMAWHFKRYNSDKDLADLELLAKLSKRGLWIDDNPIPPWEVRNMHRKGKTNTEIYSNQN
jgi:endonuclease YncB( thermonuclease family)